MNREPNLIRRSVAPEALEFPLEELDGPITPNPSFFVRNHFDTPRLDAADWSLQVEGCVERPLSLSLDALRAMPKRSVQAMLECAGNGRIALDPPVPGLQWACGAVGNAIWSGVSVRDVLMAAGLEDRTVDVLFEGADRGVVHTSPRPCGEIPFSRSLPKEVALSEGPILAYEMNGEPLAASHGFPVRLIMPGWYAAASVKWLTRIAALDHRFMGYFQTSDYAYWDWSKGLPELTPLGPMPVKSVIARPTEGTACKVGEQIEICGAAWAGLNEVTGVEVSVDGGQTWGEACLRTPPIPGSWRLWSWTWSVDGRPGPRTVLARARDSAGRVQTSERNWNYGCYVIDHSVPVTVQVTE